MKSIELFSIGLRLLGIYLLLRSFEILTNALVGYQTIANIDSGQDYSWLIFLYICASIFTFSVSIFLIKFPGTTAKCLIPATDNDQPILNGSIKDIQIVCITLLGIYALYISIPGIIFNAMSLALTPKAGIMHMSNDNYLAALITNIIKLIIGLLLTFKSSTLSALINRLAR